ncbi:MAG: glycosyltransferase [Spirochaetales bacterium]|nr:glycosyltransferase [Spirochaetales bacterium]
MNTYLAITTIICVYFLLLSLKNKETLKNLTYSPDVSTAPKVSVLIPARDEETNIGECLDSLLEQDYPNYEILVIDDNSNDGTWRIIKKYARKNNKIKAYKGKPLAEGWIGKQYACQQLIESARGEYLMFTDADTIHTSQSISWAVTNMLRHKADFMSAFLHHLIGSLGEALIVPAIYIMTTILMPLWKIPQKNNPFFSFAIGQFMVCRRKCLLAIGGYTSFKNSLVEDISLARAMKEHGYKTIFIDGKDYIHCRMYHSFKGAFKGLVKNTFGALHQSILFLAALFLVVAAVIEIPVLNLIHQCYAGGNDLLFSIIPVSMFGGIWFLVLRDRKISLSITLSYPILFFMVMIIAVTSTLKTGLLGGVEWKGRLVRCGFKHTEQPVLLKPTLTRINGRYLYPLCSAYARFIYWLTFLLVIIYNTLVFRLRIKGRENLKMADDGGFYISNHSLYLDPAIIAQVIAPGRTYFTAMEQTFDMPFVGYYIRLLGAIPVSEALPFSSLIRVSRHIIDRKKFLHFFPEGDLTHLSRNPAPFKHGVFYLAYLLNKPIIPIVINPIPRIVFGKKIYKCFTRVEATICKPVYPHSFKVNGKNSSVIIREIAEHTHQVISEVLKI